MDYNRPGAGRSSGSAIRGPLALRGWFSYYSSMRRIVLFGLVAFVAAVSMTGCDTDAAVASRNLSQAADQFEIYRRAVFYNGITDAYILVVEGYLSIEDQGNQLEVTVKTEDGEFLKHFLGLSDNVTYFVEQIDSALVSDGRYRVIFKPSTILPNIEYDPDVDREEQ